jgi:hypothetical protein
MKTLTEAQRELSRLSYEASVAMDKGEEASMTKEIAGHQFTVSYHVVNRECYDNLPTPTVMFKVAGKRVSRKAAYELLA